MIIQKTYDDGDWGVRYDTVENIITIGWKDYRVAGEVHAMQFDFDNPGNAHAFFSLCAEYAKDRDNSKEAS